MTHDGAADPVEVQRGTADVLAGSFPDLWPRLQAQHVPDRSGRCGVCRRHNDGAPVWPCTLRAVADEAERISLGLRAARILGGAPSR